MNRNEEVLALIAKQKKFYKKNLGSNFPDDDGASKLWDMIQRRLQKRIDRGDIIMLDGTLRDFSNWYLGYSQYAWAKQGDKVLQQRCFAYSNWCAYHAVKVMSAMGKIRGQINAPFSSGEVLLWWANCLLSGWAEEADTIMVLALQSTNDSDNQGIMGEGGNSLEAFPFFLMELYCLWQNRPFERKDFSHTAVYAHVFDYAVPFVYDEVLLHWNTRDLSQVDSLVTVMADYHVSRTVEQTEETPEEEEMDYEFSDIYYRFYPFEILAWLKIRALVGLDNPHSFSHPLMNQPLAEAITDTPLSRPTDHKETQQILALVKQNYPNAQL